MPTIFYYLFRHDLACAEDLLVWDSRAQSIRHVNKTLLQRVGGHHAGTPIQEGKGGCKEGTSLMERFYRGYFAINPRKSIRGSATRRSKGADLWGTNLAKITQPPSRN